MEATVNTLLHVVEIAYLTIALIWALPIAVMSLLSWFTMLRGK